jgi:uncharacterized tellurite resistance protein B-like protein
MKTIEFNRLLLKTAFSCMACDGDIDKDEVKLIKNLHKENKIFGEINLESELETLLESINKEGHQFLKDFLRELVSADLSLENELKLIEVAISTIKADKKVEYSEIKFFKVIRSNLQIKDEPILERHPDFEEYLEQDIISESYLSKLQQDFFETEELPKFQPMSEIDETLLKNIKK